MDFSNYKFRASQAHKLLVGTIGLTEVQQSDLDYLLDRQEKAKTGDDKPLTSKMEEKLKMLIEKRDNPELPKTMQTELRKIHRMETYKRNFPFTNKYVQKGLQQEEESITLYQRYLKEVKGIRTLFTKNNQRLENDWFSGEWDLPTLAEIKENGEGFDVKTSWDLTTFPFPCDDLNKQYVIQNQVYMDLTGAKKWTTAYCLVNATEHHVFNEKQKHFYELNMPSDAEHPYWNEYVEKCREVEKMLIYDYDRYVQRYKPVMEIEKEEWFGEGLDIPLSERVIEKITEYDQSIIDQLKERIIIAREYLNSLNL